MVKETVPPATGPGIYSATYSGVPVYEFQFGADLKEHVMRRRLDDWINATHILKAAGFDKPARTRILEREVQKDVHEKIQGGYGKYQGTWIPLEAGEALARRNNIYDRLQAIFSFVPGNQSPPPAPRHASKPKAPRKPAVPKWAPPAAPDLESASQQLNEEDAPDNVTIASASYMAEDDRADLSNHTAQRKRKRAETVDLPDQQHRLAELTEQQHRLYGDELLDYFLLSKQDPGAIRPDPPPNFQPDWQIDVEEHTAIHWASAMGDVNVVKELKRFGAGLRVQNIKGETPFMRSAIFTNCYDKQTFPAVMKEMWDTIDAIDNFGYTVLHHATTIKAGRGPTLSAGRYYIDNILNKLQETHPPEFFQRFIDCQDNDGNTALHLAVKDNARKCVRALLGRGASTNIPNNEGVRAEDMIKELNANNKPMERAPQRSSSPFAPDSQRRVSSRDALADPGSKSDSKPKYQSEAANVMHFKITPHVMQKFRELARSYDECYREKDQGEKDAREILKTAKTELAIVRQQIGELDNQLESPEAASKAVGEATMLQHETYSILAKQSRYHVSASLEQQLLSLMGNESYADSFDKRREIAKELRELVYEQRKIEKDYVDSLAVSGTSDKIEKYRRLLKDCLDPESAENLDSNLDSLIGIMEEDHSEGPGQTDAMVLT